MKSTFTTILYCVFIFCSCSKKTEELNNTFGSIGKISPQVHKLADMAGDSAKTDISSPMITLNSKVIEDSKKLVKRIPKHPHQPKSTRVFKNNSTKMNITNDSMELQEIMVIGYGMQKSHSVTGAVSMVRDKGLWYSDKRNEKKQAHSNLDYKSFRSHNTESYNIIYENDFLASHKNPLSTFSIDVDGASYSNSRRYINENGVFPPKDAIRIEEFINYFNYDYPEPKEHPFSIYTEYAACPWNERHQLVHIGLQGKKIKNEELAPMNLVFLIDVSGSMESEDKLPLLKQSFHLLVKNLRKEDHIAIVVYAGAAGLVLPATSGINKRTILNALDNLQAGGSTAGGEGIQLAYKVAVENFKKNGINRVILATDGDFNVGVSSDAEMTRIVEEKRQTGVYLTTLGFGTGDYKDSKMESMADHGNGNCFYIDNIQEAVKVFNTELDGTLCTIAKDVKLQVEFNPAIVKAYRLIGYENRSLKNEDFNNDQKDAGELGAGHSVTALYEIIPATSKEEISGSVDNLKYTNVPGTGNSQDLLTVKFRYKEPDGEISKLIEQVLASYPNSFHKASINFKFSAAVASFAMLLRDSKYKGNLSYENIKKLAKESKGLDEEGYRGEFIKLLNTCELFSTNAQQQN